jgi:hypothetical protein
MDAGPIGVYELALERRTRLLDEAAAERLARALRGRREARTMSALSHEDETRQQKWARKRVVQARRLRLRAAAFALAMLVLTPVWVVSQYLESGGWPQRLSSNGNPGDWSPWIVWVTLAWGFYVALTAIAMHYRRPVSDREIERELRRLTART